MTVLSPFVYWAQNEENLFLKIDLKDAEKTNVRFLQRKLHFASKGVGAQGSNDYGFSLDFYTNINTDESSYKVQDSKVDFTIIKEEKNWWPRLTSTPQKPAWLKIDFDKWQSEEDLNSEDEKVRDILEDYPDLYDKLQKEEFGYRKGTNEVPTQFLNELWEQFRKVCLILYNLLMFVGFTYVGCVLGVRYIRDGVDCFPGTYEAVGAVTRYLHILQFTEVILAFAGITSGGGFVQLVQVGGRLAVILTLIDPEPQLQIHPVIFYLYMIWSSVEVIRYPYYVTQQYKIDVPYLTWMRYSAWIILYPVGLFLESTVLYLSIPLLEQSGRMKFSLPNSYNFAFNLATFLRIYLLFFMVPTGYILMSHMYRARVKKLQKPKHLKKD